MCSGQVGGHHYVDLGLPSGLKWAVCNIGASEPWEFGDYFAWGEVSPKEDYSNETYKWGTIFNLTKYCTKGKYGIVDNKAVLESEDDAACFNWGNGWRMPTISEMTELEEGCEWEKVENFMGKGVVGMVGRSKYNGNSIFFPDAGRRDGFKTIFNGRGKYVSSSISQSHPFDCYILAPCLYGPFVEGGTSRFVGCSVRAVININNDKI